MDEPVLFHLAGVRLGDGLGPVGPALRPALFAGVGDLRRLRYDFPLILTESTEEGAAVRPLSRLVDDLVPPDRGAAGQRTRRLMLRIERAIRGLCAAGVTGTLEELWEHAADVIVSAGGSQTASDLLRLRAALPMDGEILDCDATTPLRFVSHLWRTSTQRRVDALMARIDMAASRLADLIAADLHRSGAGRRPERLRASLGPPHRGLFDLDLMAHLLATPSGALAIPPQRRRRIENTLAALQRCRAFVADIDNVVFDRIDSAVSTFHQRAHGMAATVRALAVAELEAEGRYVESVHDEQVRRPDTEWLGPEVLALFPDVAVRVAAHRDAGVAARAQLLEGLTSGAPLKVLFETDDAIGADAQLATSAMGLGDVFVVQSPSAHLYRMAAAVRAAISHPGPALISVHTGVLERSAMPPYLVSAAALTSRAFPAFSYDPGAGPDWSHRFTLDGGPQPERTWATYPLSYAGPARRRVSADVSFTTADLALCDPRRTTHFAVVLRDTWDAALVPVADGLDLDARRSGRVPYVYAVADDGRLRKVLVDQRMLATARRAAEAWQRLRELDALKVGHIGAGPGLVGMVSDAIDPVVDAAPADVPKPGGDDPYIETARCSTCNECTQLNPRMFAYDANRQAYIKDAAAGTYRELVEAAENCQVAIIHPGKPRDPREDGLADLVRRAEGFR